MVPSVVQRTRTFDLRLKPVPPSTLPPSGPIFVAGCGRSGTSLLRTLLDAHPDIYIPSESLFLVDYLKVAGRLPTSIFRALFRNEPQLRCWYDEPLPIEPSVSRTIRRIHEAMASRSGARIWGQKTPRFVRYQGLFQDAFPDCRWILVYRDPRAVCASMRASAQHTYSISRACKRWLHDNKDVVAYTHTPASRPDNVLIVKYEELVSTPEYTLQRIFRFLDVRPVDVDSLVDSARPVFFSRSAFAINTVRHGVIPDPSRIHDWINILPSYDVRFIERTCREEMRILGYIETTSGRVGRSFVVYNLIYKALDIRIIFRYMMYWPIYPLYTLVRKIVLFPFIIFPNR